MNILALETTSDFCSVALLRGATIFEKQALIPQQHAHVLLSWIEQLLEEAELTVGSLDGVSYSCGPGGFTGIRISAAIAQGIVIANNLIMLAIPSLQVIAQGIFREMMHTKIMVIQDARMRQLYYGNYVVQDKVSAISVQDDEIISLEEITTMVKDVTDQWLVTNAATLPEVEHLIEKVFGGRVISQFYPKARDVLFLAQRLLDKGFQTTAQEALPIYLRSENSWKKTVC